MAGISRKGATPLVIFKGNLDNKGFKCIAKKALFPFIRKKVPVNHILYMDNAPAHSAYVTSAFFTLNRIKTLKAPPQSPVIFFCEIFLN